MNIRRDIKIQELEAYPRNADLLPEVMTIGRGLFRRARIGGPRPDGVEHVYEICYIEQGSVEWWIDDALYDVGPGHLFINRPGEWHGGQNGMLHPCKVYWIQVNFSPLIPLPLMDAAMAQKIVHDFEHLTFRFFPAAEEVQGYFDRILAEYRQPGCFSGVMVRAVLHSLLVQTLRDHARFVERKAQPKSAGIQRALDWMAVHLAEGFTVKSVADIAEMSTGYFYRLFLDEVGYSPNEYRMRQRVIWAKYYLRESHISVTEIAHRVGFSSSQYFATVFNKLAGMTPSAYRKLMTL